MAYERLRALIDQVGPERMSVIINSAVKARRELARELGLTAYGGQRDYNKVLGYPDRLTVADYQSRYQRQDIAGRIVDLPAQDTWKKPPAVSEDGNTDTEFARAWLAIERRLRVFSRLQRLDRIAGIGRFGVLYVGYKDGEQSPANPVNEGQVGDAGDVLFLRPFSEANATVKEFEGEAQSRRYGLPVLYELNTDDGKIRVHHSRILHVADNKLDSEVYGIPRLMRVFNRLDDLLKVVGGSAEATWLNMRPGTLLTTKDDFTLDQSDAAKLERQNEIEEFLHGIARVMTLEGMDMQTAQGQVVDPKAPFEVQIALISAASGIPQRVLLGSAAGELAAAREDTRQWYGVIASRQQAYAEPDVLRPLVDAWIEYGVLPRPGNGYHVGEKNEQGTWSWPQLFEMTEQEQADITQKRASAVGSLRDPFSGRTPLDEDEQRALLGYPPRNEGPLAQVGRTIRQNYEAGAITANTYRDWLEGELEGLA